MYTNETLETNFLGIKWQNVYWRFVDKHVMVNVMIMQGASGDEDSKPALVKWKRRKDEEEEEEEGEGEEDE